MRTEEEIREALRTLRSNQPFECCAEHDAALQAGIDWLEWILNED